MLNFFFDAVRPELVLELFRTRDGREDLEVFNPK
jgi:hypothetical protein